MQIVKNTTILFDPKLAPVRFLVAPQQKGNTLQKSLYYENINCKYNEKANATNSHLPNNLFNIRDLFVFILSVQANHALERSYARFGSNHQKQSFE